MINVRMQTNKDSVNKKLTPKITVVGVGGAGGNAVNNMIASGLQGCEFVVCNSDAQALDGSMSDVKIQLGATVTGGLGAGAKPEIGMAAAEESIDDVMKYLEGSNMAFITAGMGGGTGTGAAPVIARACREAGILTVGVVTKPFHFEGSLRMKMAEAGIEEMQDYVDTLIVIPNQNLFRVANEKTTFAEAFKMADSVLQSGVRGVTDLMVMPGLINLDFADIRSAMLEMGKAMMGTGEGDGEKRAIESAEAAINNPLLDDVSMKGARGVIINVTGGMDMTLFEVDEACNRIRDEVDPNANIIFGSTFDEQLEGVMRVSVVATGIDVAEEKGRFSTRGPSIINSLTGKEQQERKMERVQPNTGAVSGSAGGSESAAVSGNNVSDASASTGSSSAAVNTGISAPARTASLGGVQQATQTGGQWKGETQKSSVTASGADLSGSVATGQSMNTPQAIMYQNSFIPPKPVEAGYAPVQSHGEASVPVQAAPSQSAGQDAQTQVRMQPQSQVQPQLDVASEPVTAKAETGGVSAPQLGGLVATRPHNNEMNEQKTQSSSSLNLRPPVPGANAHKKRTPSLFERFTSPLWNHMQDGERGEEQGESGAQSGGQTGSAGAGQSYDPSLRASSQRQGQQGSLSIDSNGSESAEDELDIPAFLRRQAN